MAGTSAAGNEIDNARGALWMTANAVFFACSTLGVRNATHALPIAEIVFMRCVLGMLVLVPALLHRGFSIYRTQSPRLHTVQIGRAHV